MGDNVFRPSKRGVLIPQAITLFVNDSSEAFHGWEDLSVSKRIDSIANSFSFKVPQRFLENNDFNLTPGSKVQVYVNDEPVITGRIEGLSIEVSSGSRSVTVSGRSLPGDLVDCSHLGPNVYNNIPFEEFTNQLIKDFGLKAFYSVTPKKISKIAAKPGDTVFQVLDKAARLQGFFWLSTREGNIRLTRAARERSTSKIHEDFNMRSGSITNNETQRFRDYKVLGQGPGTDNYPGVKSQSAEGKAKDDGIERYRPLTIIAEGNVDSETAKTRAQWEATTRIAKAINLSVTVQGWQQEDGILWGLNQLVNIKSDSLGVDGDFLSTSIQHTRSNSSGTITNIGLTREDAYTPSPVIQKSSRAANSWSLIAKDG